MFTQIGKSLKYTARNEKEVYEIYKTKFHEVIVFKINKLQNIIDCSNKLTNL